MTVLAARPAARPQRRRFAREPRTAEVQELRARIERGDYEIDPHAVADAILCRLRPPGQCS